MSKSKISILTLLTIVIAYYIFLEIYFFSDWPKADNILPEETIDQASLAEFYDWQALPELKDYRYLQQGSDQREIKDYIFHYPLGIRFPVPDKYNPLRWPENDDSLNFICLGEKSTVDLTGFFSAHFDQAVCDEDYVQGAVMARFEGSGRFVRFWMTAGSAVVNLVDNEVFRVYVDDNPDPLIQVSLKDVFTGEAGEIFAAPFGAEDYTYVAWYYPISFDSKFIIAIDQLGPSDLYYHQTDVVLDRSATFRQVANKKSDFREEIKDLHISENKHLTPDAQVIEERSNIKLSANEALEIDLEGVWTIQSFSMEFETQYLESANNSQLKLYWDENEVAAVDMPTGEFFVTAFDQDKRSVGPIYVEVNDTHVVYEFKLPMPFTSKAKLQIKNADADLVFSKIEIKGSPSVPKNPWAYFHAYSSIVKAPAESPEHPVLDEKGEGRLVGMCAQLAGQSGEGWGSHLAYSFLEGDEIIWIDGEHRVQGTGTEDYFNSSFYYLHNYKDELFAQVWGKVNDSERGERISQCRWHLFGDAVDFKESVKFDLEVGGRNPNSVLDYRTTTYYYLK